MQDIPNGLITNMNAMGLPAPQKTTLMFVAPFHNWRRVSVREHRTKRDWAEEMERLVMRDFVLKTAKLADAEKVTILLDNLNVHTKGSFYTRFEPEYCREILRRLEFVYTPVHGSWLQCCFL